MIEHKAIVQLTTSDTWVLNTVEMRRKLFIWLMKDVDKWERERVDGDDKESGDPLSF